jgi:hypothetical protein
MNAHCFRVHVLILPLFVALAQNGARRAYCDMGAKVGAKAAFGRDYLKAAPNFQKSQFMENSAAPYAQGTRYPRVIPEGADVKSGAAHASSRRPKRSTATVPASGGIVEKR